MKALFIKAVVSFALLTRKWGRNENGVKNGVKFILLYINLPSFSQPPS